VVRYDSLAAGVAGSSMPPATACERPALRNASCTAPTPAAGLSSTVMSPHIRPRISTSSPLDSAEHPHVAIDLWQNDPVTAPLRASAALSEPSRTCEVAGARLPAPRPSSTTARLGRRSDRDRAGRRRASATAAGDARRHELLRQPFVTPMNAVEAAIAVAFAEGGADLLGHHSTSGDGIGRTSAWGRWSRATRAARVKRPARVV